MEEILKQILQELKRLTEGQVRLEGRLTSVESELKEVKELAKATFGQVGMLTEFRVETNERLDRIEGALSDKVRIIDRLTARSILHEADLIELRRAK